MKTYQETYVKIKSGEDEKVLPESKATKQIEAAKEKGEEVPEIVAAQSYTFYQAETPADFAELVPSEDEQVNLFNRGIVLKQQNFVRDELTDSDFASIEGAFDLKDACGEIRERRKATPKDKVVKLLGSLTADELAAVLAQFSEVSA